MKKETNSLPELLDLIQSYQKDIPRLILIGGYSRSGKSVLSDKLRDLLEEKGYSVQCLSLDNWILDYRYRTPEMSVRERFDWDKLCIDVRRLVSREEIVLPGYDLRTRTRVKKNEKIFCFKSDVLIVEGVLALFDNLMSPDNGVRIFVDVSSDLRKERLLRFYTKDKGFDSRIAEMLIAEREKEEIPLIKSSIKNANIIFKVQIEK